MTFIVLRQEIQDRLPKGWTTVHVVSSSRILVLDAASRTRLVVRRAPSVVTTNGARILVAADGLLLISTPDEEEFLALAEPARTARMVGGWAHEKDVDNQ